MLPRPHRSLASPGIPLKGLLLIIRAVLPWSGSNTLPAFGSARCPLSPVPDKFPRFIKYEFAASRGGRYGQCRTVVVGPKVTTSVPLQPSRL